MVLRVLTALAVAAFLASCFALASGAQVIVREDESDIVFAESGDTAMVAAIDAARASLPHFWDHYSNAESIDELHLLKVGLPTPQGGTEFIWIYPTDFDADSQEYEGILTNEPFNLAGNLKYGDFVNFSQDQIIDWSYFEGDRRRGEFTTRVLIAAMSPEEAAAYEGIFHESPLP